MYLLIYALVALVILWDLYDIYLKKPQAIESNEQPSPKGAAAE